MGQANKATAFGKPGAFAIARFEADNDICAGALLYRLKWYFRPEMDGKRLTRFDREWIAMSRADWAVEAGLSLAELKNRALPRLRQSEFVKVRAMRLSPNGVKLLWMSLDLEELNAQYKDLETSVHLLNGGKVLGYFKKPTNPYKVPKDE